ncbi:hypothetical protein ACQPXT_13775 [Streptomyces sp. CA-100214]
MRRADLANARLPRAAWLPGTSYHGRIDLVAVDLVLAGRRPPSTLDDDHLLYAIVNGPGSVRSKAKALGLAELTVARYSPGYSGTYGRRGEEGPP